MALQETRWNRNGWKDKKKHILLYSVEKKKRGRNGTAFVLLKKVRSSIMGFETVSNGISRLRIKEYFYNTTVSNVYAPTETANQEETE